MASVTGITAAKANEILGMSVVSGTINGSGHLILTRGNGSTFDAGDFSAILTTIATDQVNAQLPTAVANATVGTLFPKGTVSGAIDFKTGVTNVTLVNAMFTATINGNISINGSTAFPTSPKPGTQFAFRVKQDATGGRILSVTNIKKAQGILDLSPGANAVDIIVFLFDGTDWYAGMMGMAFS